MPQSKKTTNSTGNCLWQRKTIYLCRLKMKVKMKQSAATVAVAKRTKRMMTMCLFLQLVVVKQLRTRDVLSILRRDLI